MMTLGETVLEQRERRLRVAALYAIVSAGVGLWLFEPQSLGWLPLRTSCGAASGLPCLFCGMTRAIHHLLNGELARAFYLNWLAFPFVIVAAGIALKLVAEVITSRRVFLPLPGFRLTPRALAVGLVTIVALWILQVSLAVRFEKHELLNPKGPLYSLFFD